MTFIPVKKPRFAKRYRLIDGVISGMRRTVRRTLRRTPAMQATSKNKGLSAASHKAQLLALACVNSPTAHSPIDAQFT